MKKKDIISAWRDQDAFHSLSDDERKNLPSHPAGLVAIADQDLVQVVGSVAGTHYSHCEPTASWCDDCGPGEIVLAAR